MRWPTTCKPVEAEAHQLLPDPRLTVPRMVSLPASVFELDRITIAARCGYRGEAIPDHFLEQIETAIAELPKRCDVSAGYRILPCSFPSGPEDAV